MIDISKLKHLGSGRHRDVYLLPSGRNVIKIPSNTDGVGSNYREAQIRYNFDPWTGTERSYARCRLIPGTNYLVMELIDTDYDPDCLPDWASCIDCGQVGLDRKGRFKAYDYGY